MERPVCSCGLHGILSRRHLAWASDTRRYRHFLTALVTPKSTIESTRLGIWIQGSVEGRILCLGDGSLLPALLAKQGRSVAVCLSQADSFQQRLAHFYRELADVNDIQFVPSTLPSSYEM